VHPYISSLEQLLLSEGVCRQLNIVQYHTNTRPRSRPVKQRQGSPSNTEVDDQEDTNKQVPVRDTAVVPTVTIWTKYHGYSKSGQNESSRNFVFVGVQHGRTGGLCRSTNRRFSL